MNSSPYERWKKSAKLELFINNRNGLLKCSFKQRSWSCDSRGNQLARFENKSSMKSLRNYAETSTSFSHNFRNKKCWYRFGNGSMNHPDSTLRYHCSLSREWNNDFTIIMRVSEWIMRATKRRKNATFDPARLQNGGGTVEIPFLIWAPGCWCGWKLDEAKKVKAWWGAMRL